MPKSKQLKALDSKTIKKLLSNTNKKKIDSGATSTVYKVKNIFTNKGFLCLKVLSNAIIGNNEQQTSTKDKVQVNAWNDDDYDDFSEKEEEEKNELNMEAIKSLFVEYDLLNSLDHPNIIKVHGFFFGDKKYNPSILLDYCKYNLETAIKLLTDADLIGVVYEICSAMKYVHSKKIIHRDLKMKNILINSKKHVCICDFGISKMMDISWLLNFSKKRAIILKKSTFMLLE